MLRFNVHRCWVSEYQALPDLTRAQTRLRSSTSNSKTKAGSAISVFRRSLRPNVQAPNQRLADPRQGTHRSRRFVVAGSPRPRRESRASVVQSAGAFPRRVGDGLALLSSPTTNLCCCCCGARHLVIWSGLKRNAVLQIVERGQTFRSASVLISQVSIHTYLVAW